MQRPTAFECSVCGQRVDAPATHDCQTGDATLSLVHDAEAIHNRFEPGQPIADLWHYEPFLPVERANAVSLGEGGTPLLHAPTLGSELGVTLQLKREGANPTGSTKDRGTAVLVSHAREQEAAAVTCASTGNAAASLAAYAARASLSARLFVPERISGAKAVQPSVYDAAVTHIEGGYGAAHDACRRAVTDQPWIDRSAGGSPVTATGSRTLGYEIAEQTDTAADWVAISMGNGGTLADAYRGLETFAELGFTDGVPRMLGIQAAATSPIHDDLRGDESSTEGETTADSIDVASPQRGDDARQAIRESGGSSVVVSQHDIDDALLRLGRAEGLFVEPACAATIAGIEQARASGIVDRGDRVVAVLTGTGLKDAAAGRRALRPRD